MIAIELSVGDYIRGLKDHEKIYVVTEVRAPTSVVVRRYDSINRVQIDSDFIILYRNQVVEKVTI